MTRTLCLVAILFGTLGASAGCASSSTPESEIGTGNSSGAEHAACPHCGKNESCPCAKDGQCKHDGSSEACAECPHCKAHAGHAHGQCAGCKGKGHAHQHHHGKNKAGSAQVTRHTADAQTCPNPKNHCLEESIVFVARKPLIKDYVFVEPCKVTRASEGSAEKPRAEQEGTEYTSVRTSELLLASKVYETSPAQNENLAIGQLVVYPFNKRYRLQQGPPNRQTAYQMRWRLSRIVDIDKLNESLGTVAGGHPVSIKALRTVLGDDSPTIKSTATPDAHYLSSEHVFVADSAIPEVGFIFAYVGVILDANPAKKKATYPVIRLADGWSGQVAHIYESQIPGQDDLKKGAKVIMPYTQQGGVFVPPTDRTSAITNRWWIATIVDTSELSNGFVIVNKGYRVSANAVRLVKKK